MSTAPAFVCTSQEHQANTEDWPACSQVQISLIPSTVRKCRLHCKYHVVVQFGVVIGSMPAGALQSCRQQASMGEGIHTMCSLRAVDRGNREVSLHHHSGLPGQSQTLDPLALPVATSRKLHLRALPQSEE
jgi:hypothetical protein